MQIFLAFLATGLLHFCSSSKTDQQLFLEFKDKYSKQYTTDSEMKYRFELFKKNLALLNDEPNSVDSKGKKLLGSSFSRRPVRTYSLGLNEFADLSDMEFDSFYLLPKDLLYRDSQSQHGARRSMLPQTLYGFSAYNNPQFYTAAHNPYTYMTGYPRYLQSSPTEKLKSVPKKIDWKASGIITPVKSQAKCNSCYAFAAIAAVEAWNKKLNKEDEVMSEQEIVDCSTENQECKGGQPSAVLQYVIDNGVAYTEDYPYVGKKNEKCPVKAAQAPAAKPNRLLSDTTGQSSNSTKIDPKTGKPKKLLGFNILPNGNSGGFGGAGGYEGFGGSGFFPSSQQSGYGDSYGASSAWNPYGGYQPTFNNPQTSYSNNYFGYDQPQATPATQWVYNQYGQLVQQPVKPKATTPTLQVPTTRPTQPRQPVVQPLPVVQPRPIVQPQVTPQPIPVVTPRPIPVVTPQPVPVVTPPLVPVPTPTPTPVPTPIPTPTPTNPPAATPSTPAEPSIDPEKVNKRRYNKLLSFRFVDQDIQDLIKEVSQGPVVAAHYVSNELKFYKAGIFNGDGCEGKDTVNHSVLIVGYDLEAEIPYLLIKNSWGEKWGDNGYYKIAVGDLKKPKGICLIAGTPFNLVPEFS